MGKGEKRGKVEKSGKRCGKGGNGKRWNPATGIWARARQHKWTAAKAKAPLLLCRDVAKKKSEMEKNVAAGICGQWLSIFLFLVA